MRTQLGALNSKFVISSKCLKQIFTNINRLRLGSYVMKLYGFFDIFFIQIFCINILDGKLYYSSLINFIFIEEGNWRIISQYYNLHV